MKKSKSYQNHAKVQEAGWSVTRLTVDPGAQLAWDRITPNVRERLGKKAKDGRNVAPTKMPHLYRIESDGVRILVQAWDGKVTGTVVSVATAREVEALRG